MGLVVRTTNAVGANANRAIANRAVANANRAAANRAAAIVEQLLIESPGEEILKWSGQEVGVSCGHLRRLWQC